MRFPSKSWRDFKGLSSTVTMFRVRNPFDRVVGIRDGVGGEVAGDDVSQYARFLDAGRQLGGKTRVISLCGNAVRGLDGKSDEGGGNGGEVSTEGHD